MTKTSKKQIDEDEKKIIRELQKNSSESIDKLAKRCGFSRQKVWRIMKRLEKNKSIWGYTAIADDNKLQQNTYYVLIKRTNQPLSEKLADTISLRKIQQLIPHRDVRIENSFYVHGIFDWIISFTAQDIRQAKKFCEILTRTYQGYIGELHLLETLFTVEKQGITNPNANQLKALI